MAAVSSSTDSKSTRCRAQRRDPPRGGGGRGIVVRPHLGDLGPLDLAGGVAQLRQARVHLQLACYPGEQAQLGIEHGRRPAPHGARPEVAELAQRRRVERPGLHLLHAAAGGPGELAQPPPQLARRPGGERDGEHVARVHHADPHPVGDPVRDRPGLAGPGTSQHTNGPPGGQRDLALLGIERGEHGLGAVLIRAIRLHRTSLAIRFAILPHPTDAPGKPGDAHGVASPELVWDGKEMRVSEPVVIYTTPWCGWCRRLKKQLEREGIEVSEVDIERDPAAADYVMTVNGGNQTVPTVVLPDGTALTNPSAVQIRKYLR